MIKSKCANVILIPRISEKSVRVKENNQYVFCIGNNMRKKDIAKMIEFNFHVNVESVNVCRIKGKKCNFKNIPGKKQDWKKAYVKIQKGQEISIGEV